MRGASDMVVMSFFVISGPWNNHFERNLRSIGAGSDHTWMIFGGPIEAGRVLGEFPDLTLGVAPSRKPAKRA